MQTQTLRNAILIALAFDATPEEVQQAKDIIDRIAGGVDPAVLVHAQVNTAQPSAPVTSGSGNAIPASNVIDGVQLDAAGLPWDERIHSSGDNKLNADGTWRARRGVSPATRGQVEAQLRATLAAGAPTTPAPAPTPPAATPAPAATGMSPPMPGSNMPPMPGGGAQPDPAYTALVQFIAANTKSAANLNAKFDDAYITAILQHYGIADGSLQSLAHRLDLVPTIHQWLQHALTQ